MLKRDLKIIKGANILEVPVFNNTTCMYTILKGGNNEKRTLTSSVYKCTLGFMSKNL